MSAKILIVDDEPDILDMLQYNLKKEGYEIILARDGQQALNLATKIPDLIILDIMMPELDGLEVCKRLRSNSVTSKIPILILTAKSTELDEIIGLELGADDYIQKPISLHVLLARIKALLRRSKEKVRSSDKSLSVDEIELLIDRNSYSVTMQGDEINFPKKEFELLSYLVTHRGKVFSRQHLLSAVWGQDVYVIDRTVDVHIRKIREKLGANAQFIETLKGVGYRFRAA
jgi:two-component system, OmpR family, alkaline phosphatase synthesis response regulator PhoP